jgi:hypothetical protein
VLDQLQDFRNIFALHLVHLDKAMRSLLKIVAFSDLNGGLLATLELKVESEEDLGGHLADLGLGKGVQVS